MNTLTINIDLATTPVDAVTEVLRILNGGTAAPVKKKEPVKATEPVMEAGRPATAEEAKAIESRIDRPSLKAVTIEEVRAAVAEKRTSHRQEIKDILTKHGSESVTSLDPAKYAEVLAEIKAL